jgi:hypothetical protein
MKYTPRKNGHEMTTVRLPVSLTREDVEWWKARAKVKGYKSTEWRAVLRSAADDGITHERWYSEDDGKGKQK